MSKDSTAHKWVLKDDLTEEQKEHYHKIAAQIDDGVYFDDAQNWFYLKFLKPTSDRVFILVVGLVIFFASFNLYLQIRAWFPLKVNRPIVLVNKDTQFKQVVKKMPNPYRNPDYAILRNLLVNYVEMREQFFQGSIDLLKIDQRLKKISNNSTREVAKEYQEIFDYNDLRNPIKRLGGLGSRRVTIQQVNLDIKQESFFTQASRFNSLIEMPRNAEIIYEAHESTAKKKSTERWRAFIKFNYSGVIIDKENNNLTLTEFTVIDYENSKLR